jgi:hypothetical protein
MKTFPLTPRFGRVIASIDGEVLSDVPAAVMLDGLRTGAVLLRGFGCRTAKAVEELTDRLGCKYIVHGMGGRDIRSDDRTVQVVQNRHALCLGLHFERRYFPGRPDLCCFAYGKAAPFDGDTLLADGTGMLRSMQPTTVSFLLAKRTVHTDTQGRERWSGALGTDDVEKAGRILTEMVAREPRAEIAFQFHGGKLTYSYLTPSIRTSAFNPAEEAFNANIVRSAWDYRHHLNDYFKGKFEHPGMFMEDGSDVPEDVFYELYHLAYDGAYAHRWQEGDVLLVDNSRVMHGRHGPRIGELITRFGMLQSSGQSS